MLAYSKPQRDILLHTVLGRVTHVFGPVICRWLIVGPLRKELERAWPPNVIGHEPDESLQSLQSHCRLCGACKLARE